MLELLSSQGLLFFRGTTQAQREGDISLGLDLGAKVEIILFLLVEQLMALYGGWADEDKQYSSQ